MASDEDLNLSILEYELQVKAIELALESSQNSEEKQHLLSLKNDLLELIKLTKETLPDPEIPNNGDSEQATLQDELELFYKDLGTSEDETSSREPQQKLCIDKKFKDDLLGKKCSAPYHCSMYGHKSYYNALISEIDEEATESLNKLMVRVLFLNPVRTNMITCSYFLENTCKFKDTCRHSHGHLVEFDDLKDYQEPDFKILAPKCPVLIKDNNIWVKGTVQHVNFDLKNCNVIIEQTKKDLEVNFEDLFPLKNHEDSESSDSSDSEQDFSSANEVASVSFQELFHPDAGEKLGEFEKYTRGMGSKLMIKMGYIPGTSLGKRGDGIIIPVSAQILPPGSSLDYCMNLREASQGDKDFFSVSKRLERLKKKQELQNAQAYEREKKKEANVFQFINNQVFSNQQDQQKPSTSRTTNIKNHSNKKLNIENFKLCEQLKKAEKDLQTLNESLKRHTKDSQIHKNICEKIANKSSEIQALKKSELIVRTEQDVRKNHSKLTIF